MLRHGVRLSGTCLPVREDGVVDAVVQRAEQRRHVVGEQSGRVCRQVHGVQTREHVACSRGRRRKSGGRGASQSERGGSRSGRRGGDDGVGILGVLEGEKRTDLDGDAYRVFTSIHFCNQPNSHNRTRPVQQKNRRMAEMATERYDESDMIMNNHHNTIIESEQKDDHDISVAPPSPPADSLTTQLSRALDLRRAGRGGIANNRTGGSSRAGILVGIQRMNSERENLEDSAGTAAGAAGGDATRRSSGTRSDTPMVKVHRIPRLDTRQRN